MTPSASRISLEARLAWAEALANSASGLEAAFLPDGRLSWIAPSVERLLGHHALHCLAAPDAVALLVEVTDRRAVRARLLEVQAGGGQGVVPDEVRFVHADGRVRWMACHWSALRLPGQLTGVRLSAQDIQARKEAEYRQLETMADLRRARALAEHYLARSNDERQRLGALLDTIRLGIIFMDRDHRIQYYNRAMAGMWGYGPEENLIGAREVVLQNRARLMVKAPEDFFEHIRQVVASDGVSLPYEIAMNDGRLLTDTSTVVMDSDGQRGIGRIWIYEDVTEARHAASQLAHLAERDPLTNLFNRRRFHEELGRQLALAERLGQSTGLLMIDLDGFKPINDRHGHQAGDTVLVRLADGLSHIIRRGEMLFRLGGDEFAVLLPAAAEEDLCELAHRILESMGAMEFGFGNDRVSLSASIGLALHPAHAKDEAALIHAADQAMYRAKQAGKGGWALAGTPRVLG